MASLSLVFDILAKDKASGEFRKVGDAAEDTGRKGEKLKNGLGIAAGAIAAGAAVIGAAGVKVFNHGAELEALGNKAKTVFGDQIGVVEKWAKANAGAMGLSTREATGLAASFGDLLIPMGFTREQAAQMSTDVVGLSGALSQWSGGQTSASEAADILSKAMLGERDGLKSLGISISEADVQAQLLKNGTDKLTGAALEQAKATATQELIFAKSTDAQAAFKEGGNKLLTAQNELKAKMKEVFDEVSVRLIPVFTAIATFVTDKLLPTLENLWKNHAPAVKDAFRAVSDFVTERVVPVLREIAEYVRDKVLPVLSSLADTVMGALKDAFNTIRDKIEENKPQLEDLFGAFKKVAGFVLDHVVPLLGPILKQAFKTLGDTIGTAVTVVGWIVDAFNAIKKPAVDAIAFVIDAFLGMVEALVSGAERAFGWVPGLGDKLKGAAAAVGTFRDDANRALDSVKNVVRVGADTSAAKRGIDEIISYIGKANGTLNVNVRQQGDGPGRPASGGGSTLARVTPILNRLGGYVTSTYRTPAENARVGGSPRSYHLDRANPAVDIGGPTGVLDRVHAALASAGGWRELLWRTAGHYDHVHVAHDGGMVSPSWPTMPGLRSDERPAILQTGEEVIPRNGRGDPALLAEVAGLRADVRGLVRQYQSVQRQGALV